MPSAGRIPGRYNLVVKGEYEGFDHQIPVTEFIQKLKDDDIPDEVSVVGLGDALKDGDLGEELAQAMTDRSNDLEYQNPTIQFVVGGTFHRKGKTYDLRHEGTLYPLQPLFGPQFERKGDGDWLVVPF